MRNRWVYLIAVLLLAAGVFLARHAPGWLAQRQFLRAEALRVAGKPAQALPLYDHLIEKRKWQPARLYRGVAYSQLGDADKALADYDATIRLYPRWADAYANRGDLLYALGKYDLALKDFDTALQFGPESALAHNGRGVIYHLRGQYQQALTEYSRAIALEPSRSGPTYLNRARIYFNIKQTDQALADVNQALRLVPNLYEAYDLRAHIYSQKNQADLALADASGRSGSCGDAAHRPNADFRCSDSADPHRDHGLRVVRFRKGLRIHTWAAGR